MEKLTFEYASNKNLDLIGLVRYFKPHYCESECMLCIFKYTKWPKCSTIELIDQLNKNFIK